ncbi:unnamed protein product [Bursaphelenchus xylophilus]|uniref:(pine wood nematode) hypothetical protein n=1 Tax=Bursaphelenchus xylophilus TaxID=6326 RepID=A0A1I7RN49_BURXY|nr:unnamed protein product [Bursaphelenchus xylophilus]CAG9087697.1 unnamed protein product [Bursaphelenchus xylophilus]
MAKPGDVLKIFASKPYYLGILPASRAETCMTNPGDFAIRLDTKQPIKIIAMLKGEKVYHQQLGYDGAHFWPVRKTSQKFSTFPEFIDFYHTNPLFFEEDQLFIKNINVRPAWLLPPGDVKLSKDRLGSGNFCDVYAGTYKKKVVAIKVCHTGIDTTEVAEANVAMVSEAAVMRGIRHENVVTFYGISCDEPPIMIVMESCSGGALGSHLVKEGEKIKVAERKRYIMEAAAGMCFLHSKDVIHRDLAARNCLLNSAGVVKISDFGLSKVVNSISGENLAKQHLPVRWMAPETLRKVGTFTKASDVWSYGVLCFEVFNGGVKPWPDWEVQKVATCIRNGDMPEFPSITPDEIKTMIREHVWVIDTRKRWSFEKIMKFWRSQTPKMPAPTPATQVTDSKEVSFCDDSDSKDSDVNLVVGPTQEPLSEKEEKVEKVPAKPHGSNASMTGQGSGKTTTGGDRSKRRKKSKRNNDKEPKPKNCDQPKESTPHSKDTKAAKAGTPPETTSKPPPETISKPPDDHSANLIVSELQRDMARKRGSFRRKGSREREPHPRHRKSKGTLRKVSIKLASDVNPEEDPKQSHVKSKKGSMRRSKQTKTAEQQ